jgi:hypothetical protein
MPVVQPVQPVPAVKPVARRATTWPTAAAGKAPATVIFDDVLAACMDRSGSVAFRAVPAPAADDNTPPFFVEFAERRVSTPAGGDERGQRRPFSAIAAAYRAQTTPACLRQLGLQRPCSEADVRQAYRQQARALHPDAGGDPRAFMALRAAYEEALRLTSRVAA